MKRYLNFQINIFAFLIIPVLLYFPVPAFSSIFIETGPQGIKGRAEKTALGSVMETLAIKTGFDIYVDKTIDSEIVSFSIKDNIKFEQAVKQIVSPHSFAVEYSQIKNSGITNIEKIWIVPSSRNGNEYFEYKSNAETGKPAANRENKHSFVILYNDREHLKRVNKSRFKKGLFGNPVTGYKTKRKKPDYRPLPSQIRQAYESNLQKHSQLKSKSLKQYWRAKLRNMRKINLKNKDTNGLSLGKRNQNLYRYIKRQENKQ